MGNIGKATSFIDTEGDGDVRPKLVDMLTKVTVLWHLCDIYIVKRSVMLCMLLKTNVTIVKSLFI